MLKKIKNIIKGNLYYWNTIHNEKAVNSVYDKFINLNDKEREIAEFTLACSSALILTFIGPERKKLTNVRITDKEMKTVTAEEHVGILILCFEMFSKILGLNNSQNILTQTDKKIFGDKYLIDTSINTLEKKSKTDLIKQYGQAIAEKSKIIPINDFGFNFNFYSLSSDYIQKIIDLENQIQSES